MATNLTEKEAYEAMFAFLEHYTIELNLAILEVYWVIWVIYPMEI